MSESRPLISNPGKTDRRSPVESMFLEASKWKLPGIKCQYQVGRYVLDFAVPSRMVAIEIDGHEFHSSKEQRESDNRRARDLMLDGWIVIRFSGSEVSRDPEMCAEQARLIISRRPIHEQQGTQRRD